MSDLDRKRSGNQGDVLLWAGGAVLGLVAVAWLLVAQPWAPAPTWVAEPASSTTPGMTPSSSANAATRTVAEDDIGNPLRMAELAYDAGMLLEPEGYSAWALYQRALQQDPGNAMALGGLTRIADDLVTRGTVAGEQGRLDDARTFAAQVLMVFPEHDGAQSLEQMIDATEARALETREQAESQSRESFRSAVAATVTSLELDGQSAANEGETADPGPAEPVDPALDLQRIEAEFSDALADNRLLAPQDRSARFHYARLVVSAPRDERTVQAGQHLFQALMQRAGEAVAQLDADAAQRWLDEADQLNIDARAVTAVREELVQRLVTAESSRPVPVSTLTLLSYVAPSYPPRALERLIEGWVDLEFTVDQDGRPQDIVVADGSHESYFRQEALRAVEQWRFEPRQFMGRHIAQRSYTRLRFALED